MQYAIEVLKKALVNRELRLMNAIDFSLDTPACKANIYEKTVEVGDLKRAIKMLTE